MEVEGLIARHNRRSLALGILQLLLSAVTWVLSYGFFWGAASVIGPAVGLPAYLSHVIAGLCVLVLLVESWRRGRGEDTRHSFADSGMYLDVEVSGGGGWHAVRNVQQVTGLAYGISQILFCAPRLMFRGVANLRGQVHLSRKELARAQACIDQLREADRWHVEHELDVQPTIVAAILTLGILRHRVHDGFSEIRLEKDHL